MRFMAVKKSRQRSNFHFSMTGIRKGFPARGGLSQRGKNERKEPTRPQSSLIISIRRGRLERAL